MIHEIWNIRIYEELINYNFFITHVHEIIDRNVIIQLYMYR